MQHRRCRYPRHLGSRRGYSRAGYPRSQYRMSVRCCGTPEALASMRLETPIGGVLGIVDCLPKRGQATVGVLSPYPECDWNQGYQFGQPAP